MNRKLATDIDRALKEVAKGVEMFDDIYKKVIEADTQGKKEKAETELKTQIKKLQRTRDQIKGWISSEEIREKDALIQARRVIEVRMEQFKRAEKEAKTKAFSKEGLAQADKLDPEEQARQECREWINEALEQIQEQKDAVTADLEALQSKKGKKNKEEVDEIQERLRQHTLHIFNLEMILRGLDNGVLDADEVQALKDEVEYFVQNNSDPEFIFDDSLYEPLELESRLGVLGKEVVGEVAPTVPLTDDAKDKAAKAKRKQEQDAADEAAKVEALERKSKQDQLLKQQQERQRLINEREEARRRREQIKKETEESHQQMPTSPQVSPSSPQPTQPKTAASVVAASVAEKSEGIPPIMDALPSVAPPSSAAAIIAKASGIAPSTLTMERAKSDQGAASSMASQSSLGATSQLAPGQTSNFAVSLSNSSSSTPKTVEPPIVSSVPTAPVPLPWPAIDVGQRLALFDSSLSFIPKEVDAERSKMYVPQTPFSDAPAQFPVAPAPRFDTQAAFERMDLDALFFIFFNQPGTYQQFLAAKELKKHDWRYHKQHQVWIQRHEDPSVTTNEFELGTFVYFDPISWSQKVKTNFTIEYSKLEL